jgi:hypothetical protein
LGRDKTALADGDLALALLELEEIELRLLEQLEDFEHVVFRELHQPSPTLPARLA